MDAAYSFEQPPETAVEVAGLVALDWDSMDGVFEEDEEVFVHPRDPYTRIDVSRSSWHVWVTLGETVVADSNRPRMLFESGLPVRFYLPHEDVRTDLLTPSYTTGRCPYKGIAHYWSLRDDDDSSATSSGPTLNRSATLKRSAGCCASSRSGCTSTLKRVLDLRHPEPTNDGGGSAEPGFGTAE